MFLINQAVIMETPKQSNILDGYYLKTNKEYNWETISYHTNTNIDSQMDRY